MKVATDLFITGIILGWGPCLSFCTPIIVPYIAATHSGWVKGLRAAVIFSLSRIFPYIILALIASSLGQFVVQGFYENKFGIGIYLLAGVFISILGIALLLGKWPHWHFCQVLAKHTVSNSYKGLITLGLLIGFSPCPPLLGVLTYIAFVSKNILQGIFYGACFGIGTIVSPLILFGLLAGGLSTLLLKKPLVYNIFSRLCGLFLVYLGAQLIIKVLRAGLL